MRPYEAHRARSPSELSFSLVTISSSKFRQLKKGQEYTDDSGNLAESIITKKSHRIVERKLISDNKHAIRSAVAKFLGGKADVLVLVGGTGVSLTDVTVETVRPFLEKELVGFGELFRKISYDKIGSAAMLTRATAGIAKGKLLVCLPGSPDAVDTALLSFLDEFPHIVEVARSA